MISVCILTNNSASTLQATLESVRPFSEIIILDNGSTDETRSIAENCPNVRWFESPFIGFGPLRNKAAALATHDWILALDSDEIASPSLIKELANISLDPQCVYFLPRHNFYRGKRIRGCGWDREQVGRLYHRPAICYSNDLVHESLPAHKKTLLKSPLLHTPYRTTADFLLKMERYSTLFAEQNRGRKTSSFTKALMHALFAFCRSYLIQRGLFCGAEGFIISAYNANTTFYKYLKLAECNLFFDQRKKRTGKG